MSKSRAEAFSDGVFAVAATLLVFSLQTPDVKSGLARVLLDDWPSYATYAISFGTILVIWVNHHAVLDAMEHFNRTLLFLNGFLLLTVAALPFPTSILAHYLQAGHDQQTAVAAYGIAMSLMACAFTFMNLYARKHGVINTPFNILGFAFGQFTYPLGVLASFISWYLALGIYGLTLVFYIALPLVREAQARAAAAR